MIAPHHAAPVGVRAAEGEVLALHAQLLTPTDPVQTAGSGMESAVVLATQLRGPGAVAGIHLRAVLPTDVELPTLTGQSRCFLWALLLAAPFQEGV